jgi:DNA topoisomerase I
MHPDGGRGAGDAGRYGPYVKWDKVNATLPKGAFARDGYAGRGSGADREKAGKGGKAKAPAQGGGGNPAAKKGREKAKAAKAKAWRRSQPRTGGAAVRHRRAPRRSAAIDYAASAA